MFPVSVIYILHVSKKKRLNSTPEYLKSYLKLLGSFQVMMMADDDDDCIDDDNDEEDEAEARAIAESRHMFAASSSSSQQQLRRSPYLSSSTSGTAFRGNSSGLASSNEVDMATFSPQPSSSGLNAGKKFFYGTNVNKNLPTYT